MNKLKEYIKTLLGLNIVIDPAPRIKIELLPLYLKEAYEWAIMKIENRAFVIFLQKEKNQLNTKQIEKHQEVIKEVFALPTILILDQIDVYTRTKLFEKKIAFIVPNKQMYIPQFLLDTRENGLEFKKAVKQLSPTAQLMVLIYILDKNNNEAIEKQPFKVIAANLGLKPMEITRAVANLKELKLVEIVGDKNKNIRFLMTRREIWEYALNENIFINPVLKKVYVDHLPEFVVMQSNLSALTEYTDMNPSKQLYYVLEKNNYYEHSNQHAFTDENPYEGQYCFEIWKYNPYLLSELVNLKNNVVDPLSLYLSLKEEQDERIEMALEQIEEKFIW